MQEETDNIIRSQGHTPVRMCAICRRRFPKKTLTRYVRTVDDNTGGLRKDPAQTLPGRGLYVCGDASCIEALAAGRAGRKKRKGV